MTKYSCPECGSTHIIMETSVWLNDPIGEREESFSYVCQEGCSFITEDINDLTKESR